MFSFALDFSDSSQNMCHIMHSILQNVCQLMAGQMSEHMSEDMPYPSRPMSQHMWLHGRKNVRTCWTRQQGRQNTVQKISQPLWQMMCQSTIKTWCENKRQKLCHSAWSIITCALPSSKSPLGVGITLSKVDHDIRRGETSLGFTAGGWRARGAKSVWERQRTCCAAMGFVQAQRPLH